MTIVVTGGSGFIGTALTNVLLAKGHTVIVIDTHGPSLTHTNLFFIPCDLEASMLPFNVLERTDAIIHLAGSYGSTAGTAHLIASLEQTTNKPSIFISASSVGYYGVGFDRELDERSSVGTSAAARAVEAQEKEALKAERFGCRVVIVRTAPVVGRGGFMVPIARAAALHVVFRLTKENFWMPWIHLNDLIHIYLFALETGTLQGVVNAAAPKPIQYSDFITALKKVRHALLLPMLPFLKWPYQDPVRELLISQKIVPQRLIDKGFAFAYTNIQEAVADVLQQRKRHEAN